MKDLIDYVIQNKKWWLAPIIVALAVIGGLLVVSGGSAIAPFIYALF